MTEKFVDPKRTVDGKKRAHVAFNHLDTLWFNTGTQCNLQCKNCYIESSPTNDRLEYISVADVKKYLDEFEAGPQKSKPEIGFTGGEPFMNPNFVDVLSYVLAQGYSCLVLTNAMHPMMRRKEFIKDLHKKYGNALKMRVSLDHYTSDGHNQERGDGAWSRALKGLVWLAETGFHISVAGRSLRGEDVSEIKQEYFRIFLEYNIPIDESSADRLTVFPEMQDNKDTPEITSQCWGILNVSPKDIMCSNSRMVVKHKNKPSTTVAACTLLPYDERFDLGESLEKSFQPISLNHPYCSQFCVLGGASCSAN